MKHLLRFKTFLLMAVLSILAGTSAWAESDPFYTLDTTTEAAKTTSNSYAGTGAVTLNGIEWTVNGNGQMYPWRLGGKSISNTDRTVNTNTAMGSAINKVVLTVGTASSITVNSLKLTVASDANFSNVLDEVTATFAASSDITFEPSTGTEWTTGAYYKFTFNVTVSVSSNKFVQFSGVKFYAPEGTSSNPSISADNVNITYDATASSIAYTIDNEVSGGSVSAEVTSGDWLTLGSDTNSSISFTCSPNTAAAERTATVKLTYTYNSTETVTKNVTVTQDGNPNVVNNISDITAAGTYTVRGTIVAKSQRGFIVGDGTGYIYYYNTGYDQSAYNIGDKVKLSGSVVAYGGVFEFNNSTTVTAATESNYVAENPTVLSGADMDSRVASSTPTQLSNYVQYQGTLTVSGTYYNITSIDGATTAKGSISYPINTDFTSLANQIVTVKGYYVGVSSSQYYNTLIGSIEAVSGTVATPTFSPAVGAYTEPQNVTISCATDGADIYYTTDGTEPDANSTPFTGAINVATTTTIKAIAYKGGESSAVAKGTYHITSVDNPYTVSQALGFDDSEYPIEQIYVHGIVSTAPTQAPTSYGQLTYYISDDGTTTNQLQVYKGQGLNAVEFTSQDDIQVGDEVTIIGNVKIYNSTKEFDTGNYLVAFNRPVVATPSITITPDTYERDAKAGGGELPVVCENLASDPELAVVFVEADGTTPATYNWIQATINANGNIDGQITANDTGAARTAYFKVSGKAADGSTVYSNLVTFTQQAAATEPYITVNTGVWDVDANGGSKTFGFDHENLGSNPTFEVKFFESDCVTETQCGWIWYQFDSNDNKVTITASNNDENSARTAYFKVCAEVNKTTIYSNLVTVNQAAPAVPVTGDYVKVTSTNDLTDGEYLIVYEDGALAFDGSLGTLDAVSNTVAVTIDNNTIASTTAVDAATFTVDVTAGTILSASGLYIGQTTDGNGMKTSDTEAYTNTISIDADGNAVILASGGAYLRYNATSGQERFRYFKSSSYTNQKAIALYKKSSSPAPTTPSITVNIPNPADVNADGGDNEFEVTYTNLAADPQLAVVFCDANGDAVADGTYNWITATYNATSGKIDGHIDVNTGDARTAYFKVSGKDANDNTVYSELITINQSAYNPSINIKTEGAIEFDATGGSKTLGVDYESLGSNPTFELQFFEYDGTTETQCGWITYSFASNDNKVTITGLNNDEGAARTAYFKVYAEVNKTKVYSNLVTVNQAAPVVDYATLPFAFDGGRADIENTSGLTQEGLDSDYGSSPKLKFNGSDDAVILKINERPGTLTFDIKGNPSNNVWAGTFKVQTSEDGMTYTDFATYTDLTSTVQNESFDNLDENVRYIKWIYTEKSSGNVALGNITVAQYVAPVLTPSITITPATINAKANDDGGELTVSYENLAATPNLQIVFCDANGDAVANGTYDWISAEFNTNGNIDGTIQPNTGDARTAYLVVTGVDADNNVVKSNLVTINQAAPAAPSIVFNPASIDFDSNGGSKTIGGDYFQLKDFDSTPSLEILYYESDGDTEKQGGYDWLTANVNTEGKIELVYNDNMGAARSAYLKLHAVGTTVYSTLFTVNQAAYVAPAATKINLTKTLVFNTNCGLATGGYAVNDKLTRLSGTFEGDASATDFEGFVIKDTYINSGSIQMKASSGSITFPEIESEYGFDVTVAYQTNDANVYINGEATTKADAGVVELRIATGSKYCQITSITLTPKTSVTPPPVDVKEPTIITESNGLITIVPGSDNVQVVYTTDGTDPTYNPLNGTVYSAPFNITVDTTIKAIGVDDNGNVSDVVAVQAIAPAQAGVVVWSEDWSSFDLNVSETPAANGDFTYAYTKGDNDTKLWSDALAGGTSPELLINRNGGAFTATIPLYGAYGNMTLTFKTNNKLSEVRAKVDDDTNNDITLEPATVNGKKVYTLPFTVAEGANQVVLTFTNNTGSNVRIDDFQLTAPQVAVNISSVGYSTMYYGSSNLTVPAGVTASTYWVDGDLLKVSQEYTEGAVLAKAQGYVLSGTPGSYTFTATDDVANEDPKNALRGFDTAAQTTGGSTYFLLGVYNNKVGFYWGADNGAAFKSGSHKAYLAAPAGTGVRAFYFDDVYTGVDALNLNVENENAYDMQGRRVQQLQKGGLYILNGKKVLVK